MDMCACKENKEQEQDGDSYMTNSVQERKRDENQLPTFHVG